MNFRNIPIEDHDRNTVGYVLTSGADQWPSTTPPTYVEWHRGSDSISDTRGNPKGRLILTVYAFSTKEEACRLDRDVSLWDQFEERRLATISRYGTITDTNGRKVGNVDSAGIITNTNGTLVGRIRDGDAITRAAGGAALLTIFIEKEESASYRSVGSDGCLMLILTALLGVFGIRRRH